ncbi:MAG: hypothetical protein WBV93_02060, partial [Anaerobacillus sp.]
CGTSGTGETPQERKRRGGSPPAPRKASILERKSQPPLIETISEQIIFDFEPLLQLSIIVLFVTVVELLNIVE